MRNLIKTVQSFAHREELWWKGAKIIVAVSGGPDSSVLLDVLVKLRNSYDFELTVAHVNYKLRGADSEADEALVRKKCEEYGVPLKCPVMKKLAKKGNLEQSLRAVRYQFFETLRKKIDYDLIAVGHTQDDQAETVLMRLIRGAGPQGLSAMKPMNENIIRPLLGVGRKEIMEYLATQELFYATDATNRDTALFRNKIRHELIPYLEKNYNPRIKATLAQSAKILADDYEFIEMQTLELFHREKEKNGQIVFHAREFLTMSPAIQFQGLRQVVREMNPQLIDVEFAHIQEIIKIIKSTKSKRQKMAFKGLNIERKGDKMVLWKTYN